MGKSRILFLGTPDFAAAALGRLIESKQFDIAAVISQPDRPAGRKMQLRASPVKEMALENGLRVLTPDTVNTQEFRDLVQALGAESAAVVAFGQILGQKFLDLFSKGCVNVHGSLLPRWRGAAPIQRAIMAGDQQTGVALQIIVKKLDAGPILGERKVTVADESNAIDVHDQLKILGADLLIGEYQSYLKGEIQPKVQDESLVTYAAKIDKSEAKIDWQLSGIEIFNRVRGLAMGPAAFTKYDGRIFKIHRTRVVNNSTQSDQTDSKAETESSRESSKESIAERAGKIIAVGSASFTVACGQGTLEVLEIQPESRSRQSVAEFLRGHPLKVGDRFD